MGGICGSPRSSHAVLSSPDRYTQPGATQQTQLAPITTSAAGARPRHAVHALARGSPHPRDRLYACMDNSTYTGAGARSMGAARPGHYDSQKETFGRF